MIKEEQSHSDLKHLFEETKKNQISAQGDDKELLALSRQWLHATSRHQYSHHFTWLGIPIIQFPQDILAMQEIIWKIRPELIIETGVAHGGSLIFYASLLELLGENGRVLGIDIDIRPQNRATIESHPMKKRIDLLEGSSIDPEVLVHVTKAAEGKKSVLVALDSNHCHAHVLEELRRYSPFVSRGSYLIVFDTEIEFAPAGFFPDRPWDIGNNPMTAVQEFLKNNARFELDSLYEKKLLITVSPGGYLKCVKH